MRWGPGRVRPQLVVAGEQFFQWLHNDRVSAWSDGRIWNAHRLLELRRGSYRLRRSRWSLWLTAEAPWARGVRSVGQLWGASSPKQPPEHTRNPK